VVRMRVVAFWALFGMGSALLIVSLVGSQVPWPSCTFEEVASLAAGLLLAGSLVLGRFRRPVGHWRASLIPTVVLSGELMLCLYCLASLLTYRGRCAMQENGARSQSRDE
jgi:hypothetical protein